MNQEGFNRLAGMVLYAFGAWASLAALLYIAAWAPADPLMESSRAILIIGASVALAMCVIGATSKLLAAAGANVRDVNPKG